MPWMPGNFIQIQDLVSICKHGTTPSTGTAHMQHICALALLTQAA